MTRLEEIQEIMGSYNKEKTGIESTVNKDEIISFHTKQRELQELKISTREKLIKLRESVYVEWGKKLEELNVKTKKLNDSNDIEQIMILYDEIKTKKSEIAELRNSIDTVDKHLNDELNMSAEVFIKSKPWENRGATPIDEELVLKDESDNLRKNAIQLEEALPFVDDTLEHKNAQDKNQLLINTFLDISEGLDTINIHDSSSRYIGNNDNKDLTKVEIKRVCLPNGKYINRADFEEALKHYLEVNKNRKLLVLDKKSYELDPSNLNKCNELLSQCGSIFVTQDHDAFAAGNGELENLGNMPENIKPGNYVPVKEVVYSLVDLVREKEYKKTMKQS